MSYDINPLGTTMYLRQLDRQAARNCQPSPGIQGQTNGYIDFYARLAVRFRNTARVDILERLKPALRHWSSMQRKMTSL